MQRTQSYYQFCKTTAAIVAISLVHGIASAPANAGGIHIAIVDGKPGHKPFLDFVRQRAGEDPVVVSFSQSGWDEIAMQRGETSVEQVNSMRTRISAAVESAADNGVGLVVVFRIESTEGAAWGALGANVVTGAIDARDSSLSRTLYTHGRNGANAVQRLVQTTSQRQSYNNLVLFGGPLDASAFSTGLERAGYAPNQCKVFTTQYSPSTERHSNGYVHVHVESKDGREVDENTLLDSFGTDEFRLSVNHKGQQWLLISAPDNLAADPRGQGYSRLTRHELNRRLSPEPAVNVAEMSDQQLLDTHVSAVNRLAEIERSVLQQRGAKNLPSDDPKTFWRDRNLWNQFDLERDRAAVEMCSAIEEQLTRITSESSGEEEKESLRKVASLGEEYTREFHYDEHAQLVKTAQMCERELNHRGIDSLFIGALYDVMAVENDAVSQDLAGLLLKWRRLDLIAEAHYLSALAYSHEITDPAWDVITFVKAVPKLAAQESLKGVARMLACGALKEVTQRSLVGAIRQSLHEASDQSFRVPMDEHFAELSGQIDSRRQQILQLKRDSLLASAGRRREYYVYRWNEETLRKIFASDTIVEQNYELWVSTAKHRILTNYFKRKLTEAGLRKQREELAETAHTEEIARLNGEVKKLEAQRRDVDTGNPWTMYDQEWKAATEADVEEVAVLWRIARIVVENPEYYDAVMALFVLSIDDKVTIFIDALRAERARVARTQAAAETSSETIAVDLTGELAGKWKAVNDDPAWDVSSLAGSRWFNVRRKDGGKAVWIYDGEDDAVGDIADAIQKKLKEARMSADAVVVIGGHPTDKKTMALVAELKRRGLKPVVEDTRGLTKEQAVKAVAARVLKERGKSRGTEIVGVVLPNGSDKKPAADSVLDLEHLAKRGLRFRNIYAVNPLCSPRRATMLSSQWNQARAGEQLAVVSPLHGGLGSPPTPPMDFPVASLIWRSETEIPMHYASKAGAFYFTSLFESEDSSEEPARDEAIVVLAAPEKATVTINGRDRGQDRHFRFRPISATRVSYYVFCVHLPNGQAVERTVKVTGGKCVRLLALSLDTGSDSWRLVVRLSADTKLSSLISSHLEEGQRLLGRGLPREALKKFDWAVQLELGSAMARARRGSAYAALDQLDRAIADYDKAIELDPKFVYAYNSRGYAWSSKGEHQKAIDDFGKAIELDPTSAYAYDSRANAWSNKGEYQRAIEDYDKVIELDPTRVDAYIYRGNARKSKGEHDRAIKDYDKAIEIDPKCAVAYGTRGIAWRDKGQCDRAIEDYSRAIELDPEYLPAYISRGNAWCTKGQYDRAIEDYNRAIGLDPESVAAYNNRGNAWCAKRRYDRAIADCDKAIELDPKYVRSYYNRGRAWAEKGEYDRAIEDYDKAIEVAPKHALAYRNRALAWIKKGDNIRAISGCGELIAIASDQATSHIFRAEIWHEIDEDDKAISDCNSAIEIDPMHAGAYSVRGSAWHGKGEHDRAIEDYDRAIELAPKKAIYYTFRANAFNGNGGFEQAIADAERALSLTPKLAIAFDVRGNAHSGMGEYDKAIQDYNREAELDPTSVRAYGGRGAALAQMGEFDKAIADCDKAIELEPEYVVAYTNRAGAWNGLGEYDKAIADCNRALKLNAELPVAYNNRANAWAGMEEWDNAIADYGMALLLDPTLATALVNRADACRVTGQWEKALADYDASLRLKPYSVDAHIGRGIVKLARQEWDDAIVAFTLAITFDADNALAFVSRGDAWLFKGMVDKAIADFDRAIELEPDCIDAYVGRGKAWLAKAGYSKAIEDCDKVLETMPGHQPATDCREQCQQHLRPTN